MFPRASRSANVVVLLVALLLPTAGCLSSAKPKVSPLQRLHAETAVQVATIVADSIEALDAAVSTQNFSDGRGGAVTVDGHGDSTIVYTWTGSSIWGGGTVKTVEGGRTRAIFNASYAAVGNGFEFLVRGATRGISVDVRVISTLNATETKLAINGLAVLNRSEFAVTGGGTTDGVAGTADWGYTITNLDTDVRLTSGVQFANGTCSGPFALTKGPKPLAASLVENDCSVTMAFIDGSEATYEVFPDPRPVLLGGDPRR